MDRLKKIANLLKIARDSDETYRYLINKIINLFKESAIDISSDNYIKKYKIDLRDLHFYDYTILDITALGDYLFLEIYHPLKDTRTDKNKVFRAAYVRRSTIRWYLKEYEWEELNKSGSLINNLLTKDPVLMAHELTHFLNDTRFNNLKSNNAVAKYQKKNTGGESSGYINSTEEVQARIMAIIFFIMNELLDNDKDLFDLYHEKWLPIYEKKNGTKREVFLAKLLYYVVNNDINSFLNDIFNESYTLYIGNDLLLESTKKRYLKRLYDLFIEIKNQFEKKKKQNNEEYNDYYDFNI
jgi:hypothetical protein